jgi:phosphate transport system permease protein
MNTRYLTEKVMVFLMKLTLSVVLLSILGIIGIICLKGFPALSLSMITGTQGTEYYSGNEGGIANAIVGSLYVAGGATILGLLISLPVALYLNHPKCHAIFQKYLRMVLDILYGIPTVVYGSMVFLVMIYIGGRSSLFWGVITVSLFVCPILIRAVDELFQAVPVRILESSLILGATHLETLIHIGIKQILPGIMSAILLAFGRAIGDAASLLFTAGYSSDIPASLSDPVATLPLAVFFQLSSPFPSVRERAYAAAVILLFIVILISVSSRYLTHRYTRYVVR